jgi:protein YIPF6
MGDVESQGIQGFGRDLRGLVGRWPDADGILQGGLSEGLRDWDLWYVGPGVKEALG